MYTELKEEDIQKNLAMVSYEFFLQMITNAEELVRISAEMKNTPAIDGVIGPVGDKGPRGPSY